MSNAHLPIALSFAVPLRIFAYIEKGGPSKEDYERAREHSDLLGEKGDILLFGGGKKGVVADLFNRLVDSIAILSFAPGGVTCFGSTWDVAPLRDRLRERGVIV